MQSMLLRFKTPIHVALAISQLKYIRIGDLVLTCRINATLNTSMCNERKRIMSRRAQSPHHFIIELFTRIELHQPKRNHFPRRLISYLLKYAFDGLEYSNLVGFSHLASNNDIGKGILITIPSKFEN
jgi:hypothetical protein